MKFVEAQKIRKAQQNRKGQFKARERPSHTANGRQIVECCENHTCHISPSGEKRREFPTFGIQQISPLSNPKVGNSPQKWGILFSDFLTQATTTLDHFALTVLIKLMKSPKGSEIQGSRN